MRYKLEKLIDGEWYLEGIYDTVHDVATVCFHLGRTASVYEAIRVTEVV